MDKDTKDIINRFIAYRKKYWRVVKDEGGGMAAECFKVNEKKSDQDIFDLCALGVHTLWQVKDTKGMLKPESWYSLMAIMLEIGEYHIKEMTSDHSDKSRLN